MESLVKFGLLFIFTVHQANSAKNVEIFTNKVVKHLLPPESRNNNNGSSTSNMIWSPISIYESLLTLTNMAEGPTLSELQELLGNKTDTKNNYDQNNNEESPSLTVKTALFIQKNLTMNETVLRNLQGLVHTFNRAHSLRCKINKWVNKTTKGLIPKIAVDQMEDNTKVVLVNAVAFTGIWKTKFHKDKTTLKEFRGKSGTTKVDMMRQKSMESYRQFPTFKVLKLGYEDGHMQAIFILPSGESEQDVYEIFSHLHDDDGKLREILEQLEPTELEVEIPRMKISCNVPIKDALMKAGLSTIFTPFALLGKGLQDQQNSSLSLHIDNIIHQTMIEMDESGTKAAASSAAVLELLSDLPVTKFVVDRPFILFLRWEGQVTFFEGIVNDLPPSSESEEPKIVLHDNLVHKEIRENISSEERFQTPEPKDPEALRFPNPNPNVYTTIIKPKFLGENATVK